MAKSRISASDFLSMIEEENQHIKRDISRQTYLGQQAAQEAQKSPTLELKTEALGASPAFSNSKAAPLNLGQSSDKPKTQLRTEVRSNLGQSSDKPRTNNVLVSEVNTESSDKPKTQLRTEVRSNLGQSSDKPRTNVSFIGLVGLQREIVLFLFETLKVSLSKVTPPIAISHLAESCKTTVLSAQKTLQRLGKAGLVERVEFKNGRSGWTRYSLDERIYSEILQSESSDKLKTNLGQSSDKLKTQPRTEPRTNSPVVVVSSNNINTTTTEEPCFVIPSTLQGMVSRKQLSQFVLDGKIGEWELQLSLDSFAHDLKNNLIKSRSSNPVAVLIGAIKNNGSYNSVKYAEVLKADLKPALEAQQTIKNSISERREGEEWVNYQSFKKTNPEAFESIVKKYRDQNLPEAMIDDFGFMEFKEKEI